MEKVYLHIKINYYDMRVNTKMILKVEMEPYSSQTTKSPIQDNLEMECLMAKVGYLSLMVLKII
jgi:hypothetical protein